MYLTDNLNEYFKNPYNPKHPLSQANRGAHKGGG